MTHILRASLFPFVFACALTPAVPAQTQASADANRAGAYYHYGLAKLYENQALSSGRQDLATQAIEQYKLAMDADPASRTLQNGLANLYFRLGRIREAVSSAQDQVTRHPDDVEAHMLLGRVYLRSLGDGQTPQSSDILHTAIKEYETIVALKPSDTEVRLLLGQLYGLDHDSVKAEAQFKAAQQLDPTSEEVALSLARLYSEEGDMAKAAKNLEAVPPSERSERMYLALAGIYDQLKEPRKAVEAYQAILEQDPDNADAKRGLAAALTASGQTDAAAKLYSQMLSADPQDAQALIHRGELERQQGMYEQSLTTLAKAKTLVSDKLEISYNEALDNDALGRFDEAIRILTGMLTTSVPADGKSTDADRGNRALFLDRLGIVQREAGKTDDAVATYKQLAAMGGEFQIRGTDGEVEADRDAHRWKAALAASADAAKAAPTSQGAQLTYARQLGDNGEVDAALKLARAQLKGTPEDRDAYFTIADIAVRARRWQESLQALEKVEAMSGKPEDKVFLYFYRGTVAERQKLYEQAEAEFRKGLAIDPKSAAIQNYLGYMFADRGTHLDEAVKLLKEAVAFDPQNAAYLDSLGWAYYKQGQYALANEFARKAVQRMGNDPAVLDHLGEIEAKSGHLQLAVENWQRSLKSYATSLSADADPADVARVQRNLESARVRLAHNGTGAAK